MMAAATGLPSVGYKTWCACRQSVCIRCSTIHEVTNPLITKKPTDYRPSVPGPTYLEDCFFLITCTTCFMRLLTSFRRYIQRLVSMSITDGLASTNLHSCAHAWWQGGKSNDAPLISLFFTDILGLCFYKLASVCMVDIEGHPWRYFTKLCDFNVLMNILVTCL